MEKLVSTFLKLSETIGKKASSMHLDGDAWAIIRNKFTDIANIIRKNNLLIPSKYIEYVNLRVKYFLKSRLDFDAYALRSIRRIKLIAPKNFNNLRYVKVHDIFNNSYELYAYEDYVDKKNQEYFKNSFELCKDYFILNENQRLSIIQLISDFSRELKNEVHEDELEITEDELIEIFRHFPEETEYKLWVCYKHKAFTKDLVSWFLYKRDEMNEFIELFGDDDNKDFEIK